jgi:hypothetical protein
MPLNIPNVSKLISVIRARLQGAESDDLPEGWQADILLILHALGLARQTSNVRVEGVSIRHGAYLDILGNPLVGINVCGEALYSPCTEAIIFLELCGKIVAECADPEVSVQKVSEFAESCKPLRPIALTSYGDFLVERHCGKLDDGRIRDETSLPLPGKGIIGNHDTCGGWFVFRKGSATHYWLECIQGCPLKLRVPVEARTYGDLRKWFAQNPDGQMSSPRGAPRYT